MMLKIFEIFKKYRWPLFSGLLIGTSYIPFPPWALLFCFVPLWLFLIKDAKTWREGFIAGWWTQFTLTLIGFHWVAYTAAKFGGFPWPVAILTLLLFASGVHLYIPLTSALVVFLKKRFHWQPSIALFALATITSLAERLWPSIFPWNLGYTLLWAKIPAYNWADVIGFEGLASLVLLLNAWLAWIWEQRHRRRVIERHIFIFLVFIVSVNLTGFFHAQRWSEFDRTLRVSIVQANIGDLEKVFAEKGQNHFQNSIIESYLRLTEQAVQATPNTELLVWPETAFPDFLNTYNRTSRYPELLAKGLEKFGKPLLTGAYSKDAPGTTAQRKTYNGLFLVDASAHLLDQPYHKTNLLAFGEYFPFSEYVPFLVKLLPFIANFGRGEGPKVLNYSHIEGPLKIGGQICYEGLYPDFSRGLAEQKADILANVTNDSWFGKNFEPHQHLYMTLARGIETRRPLIRSTNTGISTVMLADGTLLQQSPQHTEWHGTFDLRLKKSAPTTDFVLWGHYDWILLFAALLVVLFKGVRNARTHRS